MTRQGDGWGGLDPVQRVLRAVAILAFLALLALVVIDPTRRDATLDALLLGAILLALGYPVALKLPGLAAKDKPKEPPDDV